VGARKVGHFMALCDASGTSEKTRRGHATLIARLELGGVAEGQHRLISDIREGKNVRHAERNRGRAQSPSAQTHGLCRKIS
jgi:hypothetical protein